MKISFVIPVFRNEGSIKITFEKLSLLASKLEVKSDFVFVNDGSDDGSLEELKSLLVFQSPDIKVGIISLSRNFGQTVAVIAGLKEVSGDVVVVMSADLQEPIELIEEMIDRWKSGSSIVVGHRVDRQDSFVATATSNIFYGFQRFINPKMPKGGFDFVLLDRKPLDVLNSIDERNRFLQGDILWLGFPISFIPYKRLKREFGKSQWTLSKKFKYLVDGVLNTSYFPLRAMSFLGFITALIGFLYAINIAYARIVDKVPFTGWAPIMILLLLIGGILMLMLGIIGEYLWRTYDESRKRPLYIIEQKF